MTLTDQVAKLTERCRAGDMDAFEELIVATKWVLIRQGHLPFGNPVVSAADILQMVYVKFWEHCNEVEPRTALDYLITIAANKATDELRKRGAQKRCRAVCLKEWMQYAEDHGVDEAEVLIDRAADVEGAIYLRERRRLLRATVDRLSPAYNAVITAYWRGETVGESARRMGIPEGTVKSRRSHAFYRMRRMLEPMREAL